MCGVCGNLPGPRRRWVMYLVSGHGRAAAAAAAAATAAVAAA